MAVLSRTCLREATGLWLFYSAAYLTLVAVAFSAPFLRKGVPIGAILATLPDQLIFLGIITVPLAFVTALLAVLGRMRESGELTALMAAGISSWRVARSLLPLTILVAALIGVVAHTVLPEATRRVRESKAALLKQAIAAQVARKRPIWQDADATIAAIAAEDGRLRHCFAVQRLSDGRLAYIYAPTARWVTDPDQPGGALGFELLRAEVLYLVPDEAAGETHPGAELTTAFLERSIVWPEDREVTHRKPDTLSTAEIEAEIPLMRERYRQEPHPTWNKVLRNLQLAWHMRWVMPCAVLAFWAMACGLSLSIGRNNRMIAICLGVLIVVGTLLPPLAVVKSSARQLAFDPGWVIWPPVVLVALVGLFLMWKKR